jgi:hypothetical protein
VNLAGRSYYRYVDLVPARTGTVENVYALPTTARTVLAACVAPAADAGAFSVACEHALSSLRLTSGQVLPVGPNPAYAARLSVIVSKLNGLRSSAERRLATASTPAGQAKAAQELAQVLATAATQTKKLEPGPIGSSENASIARALQHLGAAYAALANAANHNDRRGYGSARRAEILAATELKSRFEQLSQAGYTIG